MTLPEQSVSSPLRVIDTNNTSKKEAKEPKEILREEVLQLAANDLWRTIFFDDHHHKIFNSLDHAYKTGEHLLSEYLSEIDEFESKQTDLNNPEEFENFVKNPESLPGRIQGESMYESFVRYAEMLRCRVAILGTLLRSPIISEPKEYWQEWKNQSYDEDEGE